MGSAENDVVKCSKDCYLKYKTVNVIMIDGAVGNALILECKTGETISKE